MLVALGIGGFFLAGLLVSVRLLWLWRRTRRLPELLGALSLLGIGPLGACVVMTGLVLFRGTDAMPLFRSGGLAIQSLGFVATAAFTWRVFHPRAPWAAGLAATLALGLLAEGLWLSLFPSAPGAFGPWNHLSIGFKIVCLGWGALASLRYWRITRRRVAIGFTDPVVSASFLMWGISLGGGAVGFAITYAAILLHGAGGHLTPGVQLAISGCGLIAAVTLYLAFLPPERYGRWITARATPAPVPTHG